MSSDSPTVGLGRPHIEAHDSQHVAEPDLVDKGLAHDSVGLAAAVAMSVSSVLARLCPDRHAWPDGDRGRHPDAGDLPRRVRADAAGGLRVPGAQQGRAGRGTSFTWTVKAFGPHVGWMCGWGLVIAIVIVLSNLAGVAVTFLYLFVAEVVGDPDIATWGDTKAVNVVTCLAFVAVATYIAYRGMTTTKGVTFVLLAIQMVALVLFVALALVKALNGDATTAIDFQWSWLSPLSLESFSVLATALSLSIFMYWGWDTCLSANEETSGSERTPGLAAVLTLLILGTT